MEIYEALTSWALFLGLGVVCALYYWPATQRNGLTGQVKQQLRQSATQQPPRERSEKRSHSYAETAKSGEGDVKQQQQEALRNTKSAEKKTADSKKSQPAKATPASKAAIEEDDEEAVDTSTKQFAEQLLKARKGEVITGNKSQDQRIRTVKQSTVKSAEPVAASEEESMRTAQSGDVSDMLEPTRAGPTVLRVTGEAKPAKGKVNRSSNEEVVETKKQRQNRKKVEEARIAREAEEQERKAMMEKQRRAAREARGEPSRNGIIASKPTTNNVWTVSNSAPINEAPVANGQTVPLLDTFDAESTASSNGAPGNSTAATSTTDGAGAQWETELPSEEEQMAQAMKESGDESGWTTVAVPKKQQKKKTSTDGDSTPVAEHPPPVVKPKPVVAAPPTTSNGKLKGFQALQVQYSQRTDADPNDPESWDA